MYLVCVEQLTRDEIGAAAAVHAELGREYDQAVAESLVERIGAEVDRRVDARLAQPQASPVPVRRAGTAASVVLALGSVITGGITSVSLLDTVNNGNGNPPNTLILVILIIWIAIGAINVSFNRSR
jgi:hypothetical protein